MTQAIYQSIKKKRLKELTESDLQVGDILIFEDYNFDLQKFGDLLYCFNFKGVFDYLLHYLIAWFDPGKEGHQYKNIYHAGVWGKVNRNRDSKEPFFQKCVVQAGGDGISSATLEAMLKHPTVMNIYVCRYKKKDANFEENINTSIQNFYAKKGKYSYKTAWLLAVICSLRYTKGTLHKLLIRWFFFTNIANYIVEKILFYINQYNNKHQREMVACSPLVAMMYKNANYELPVYVFQSLKPEMPEPKFNLKGLAEKLPLQTTISDNDEWPVIKETVITPRQLMESPDVKMVGVLRGIAN